MNQLSLLPQAPKAESKPREYSSEMLDLFARLRKEAADFLAAINYVNETRYTDIIHASTAEMMAARNFIGWSRVVKRQILTKMPHELKLIKPRSEITKQRGRCTKMLNRLRTKSPLFWLDEAQEKLLTNPEYYGICVLPSEAVCTVKPGQRLAWMTTQQAIERDNEMTRQGY